MVASIRDDMQAVRTRAARSAVLELPVDGGLPVGLKCLVHVESTLLPVVARARAGTSASV